MPPVPDLYLLKTVVYLCFTYNRPQKFVSNYANPEIVHCKKKIYTYEIERWLCYFYLFHFNPIPTHLVSSHICLARILFTIIANTQPITGNLLDRLENSQEKHVVVKLKTSVSLQITKTLGICKIRTSCLSLEECERDTSVLITRNSWLLCKLSCLWQSRRHAASRVKEVWDPRNTSSCLKQSHYIEWCHQYLTAESLCNRRWYSFKNVPRLCVYYLLIVRRWYLI